MATMPPAPKPVVEYGGANTGFGFFILFVVWMIFAVLLIVLIPRQGAARAQKAADCTTIPTPKPAPIVHTSDDRDSMQPVLVLGHFERGA